MPAFALDDRMVGSDHPPLVIAEVGINHNGSLDLAKTMVDAAKAAGCECIKFQCHVIEDEMIPNDVIPGNADRSIWSIMEDAALSEADERALYDYVCEQGLLYLSTPFSRAAADRLESMGVSAYKIGSGECNNYPLIEHVAAFGKPMIVSTGMNDLDSVAKTVDRLRAADVPFALLHCTSVYPTPPRLVRLGAMVELAEAFPDAVVGLSDHSETIYPCLGAVALGASILERHFTTDRALPGPDQPISMEPDDLRELIRGSREVFEARGGSKTVLPEEQPTIDFAYACVVTTRPVAEGEAFSPDNLWVKRPGTGEILAERYPELLGRVANRDIPPDVQLRWEWVS